MINSKILNIPTEQINETLLTTPDIIFQNKNGKCLAYLKNFDYYHVLCIVDPNNRILDLHIKLPNKFVEKSNTNTKNLLNEFLKIVGVPWGSHNNEFIISLNIQENEIYVSPTTNNRTINMKFYMKDGNYYHFFFHVDIIKYRDFLIDSDIGI